MRLTAQRSTADDLWPAGKMRVSAAPCFALLPCLIDSSERRKWKVRRERRRRRRRREKQKEETEGKREGGEKEEEERRERGRLLYEYPK